MSRSILQFLNKTQSLLSLKSIHSRLLVEGSVAFSDLLVNKLLRLYSRFNATDYARKIFDEILEPNVFIWTALIHGYVDNQQYSEALSLFGRMLGESVVPLNFTIASVLKALAREQRVRDGETVYGVVLKSGFGSDLLVQNAVLDLFMRCGQVEVAGRVFSEIGGKDVVSWNCMIFGYANNGKVEFARKLFDEMPEKNVISWTSMISGYIKDGNMLEASILFERMPTKDLASWKVMVSGYMDAGDVVAAYRVFDSMPIHDVGTWNLMILGFSKVGDIEAAKEYFSKMPIRNVASWTIMIDGYMKVGDVDNARSLFNQMPEKNVVSWSTMIEGYGRNGQARDALELYKLFKETNMKPDETFMLGVISACSQLGIIDAAESVFSDISGTSTLSNLRLVTTLIDMYAKCGSIERAVQVFEMASQKDLLCYSTMIAAFANHGFSQDAITLFKEMQRENIKPDAITFLGVLSACNHGGLVDDGVKYFEQMIDEWGIQPSEKHYACVIDLLGRAGCLQEAYNSICNMSIVPNAIIWGALLAACRVHRNVQLAEVAAAELFKIEPDNSGNYILLSNTYAAAGRWDGVAKVRAMIRKHHVRKNRGHSLIEVACSVHEFVMGDTSHINSESIYFILDLLSEDMKLQDYAVDSKSKEVSPLHTLWPSDVFPNNIMEMDFENDMYRKNEFSGNFFS